MWRTFAMLCVLCGGMFSTASRAAADVPMPTEAEVAAAVAEEIAGMNVCSSYLPFAFGSNNGIALLQDRNWRESDPIKAAIAAFVHEKLATQGTQPDANGNQVPTLQLTAAGKQAFDPTWGRGVLCFAKRKLVDVVMYTPPAMQDTYVVVNVVYRWKPDAVAPWAAPLARAQALGGISAADLAADKRETMVLIYTNQGWKAQTWFGSPIGKPARP